MLGEIVKDPVELTSITFPSAVLAVVIFTFRQNIHPALEKLPDPLSGNIYGGLLFLILTLVISLVIKRVSHDLLNWIYDKFYRDRKRKDKDTWYQRAIKEANLTNDPLINKYQESLQALKEKNNPATVKIDLIQIQSKLARSMSLILFVFAVISILKPNLIFFIGCLAVSVYFLYAFLKGRWEASELVYQARLEELSRLD